MSGIGGYQKRIPIIDLFEKFLSLLMNASYDLAVYKCMFSGNGVIK